MVKVLFVCLGNICRSPMAEGIFNEIISMNGFSDKIKCDSAGTANYHIGRPPDPRTIETCLKHDIQLKHKGKQLSIADFDDFHYVIAMDSENFKNIKRLGYSPASCKVYMMRDFDPEKDSIDVPDPYYGEIGGFEVVYKMLWRSGEKLLEHLIKTHELK